MLATVATISSARLDQGAFACVQHSPLSRLLLLSQRMLFLFVQLTESLISGLYPLAPLWSRISHPSKIEIEKWFGQESSVAEAVSIF